MGKIETIIKFIAISVLILFIVFAIIYPIYFGNFGVSDNPYDWTNTVRFFSSFLLVAVSLLNVWLIVRIHSLTVGLQKEITNKLLDVQKGKYKFDELGNELSEYDKFYKNYKNQNNIVNPQYVETLTNLYQHIWTLSVYKSSFYDFLSSEEFQKMFDKLGDSLNDFIAAVYDYQEFRNFLSTSGQMG